MSNGHETKNPPPPPPPPPPPGGTGPGNPSYPTMALRNPPQHLLGKGRGCRRPPVGGTIGGLMGRVDRFAACTTCIDWIALRAYQALRPAAA